MIKFYMDAMQDVAYANDNVIEKLICCKHFSDKSTTTCIGPHIVVKIQQPLSLNEVTYDNRSKYHIYQISSTSQIYKIYH